MAAPNGGRVTAETGLSSSFYVGTTTHTRRQPAFNQFTYSIFMACVDLAELEAGALDCWPFFSTRTPWALASVLARDHLAAQPGAAPLVERVRDVVRRETDVHCRGPVRLLTGMRVLGLEFNPVSFYYLLSEDGSSVDALVAEVNNIPWFEQHLYVVVPRKDAAARTGPPADHAGIRLLPFTSHAKAFHVSPFMPISGISYDWLVSAPEEKLGVRIGLRKEGESFFSASIALERRPFSIAGIMYEAGKLWRRGFTFYSHPNGAETASSKAIESLVLFFVRLQELLPKRESQKLS